MRECVDRLIFVMKRIDMYHCERPFLYKSDGKVTIGRSLVLVKPFCLVPHGVDFTRLSFVQRVPFVVSTVLEIVKRNPEKANLFIEGWIKTMREE